MDNPRLHMNSLVNQLNHFGIPETHITQIMESSYNLTESIFDAILFFHQRDKASQEMLDIIKEIHLSVESAYNSVRSTYLRKQLYSKTQFYVHPEIKGLQPDCKLSPKQNNFTYVSIVETLKKVLENKDYFNAVFKSSENQVSEDIMTSYKDGLNYKKTTNFHKDEYNLFIQIYTDEFECAKHSRLSKTKLGAIYFTLKNLPESVASKIENIFLVALYNCEYIKRGSDRSFNDICKPLMEEILSLEKTGILVNDHVIKGTIVSICSDNLGANQILGFVKSFNKTQFCRFCVFPEKDFQKVFHEKSTRIRTMKDYIEDGQNNTNGVTHRSIFADLTYFDMFEILTVDCMHDFLEGICAFTMTSFLKEAMKFDNNVIQNLNERIKHFSYGEAFIRDKPSPIVLDKSNLGQHAAQCWCLISHFPFFMDGITPTTCKEKMEVIFQLLDVMSIVFAPKISTGQISILEILISDFLENYTTFFGHMKPKFHLLIHYPNVIRRLGPPTTFWCMRYESKHRFFIQIGKRITSFKNICYTFGLRHQQHFTEKGLIMQNEVIKGPEKKIPAIELNCKGIVLTSLKINSQTTVNKYSWIQNNFKHKLGSFICQGIDENNDFPKFCEIIDIFSINDVIYFGVKLWSTKYFDRSLYAYNVKETKDLGLLKMTDSLPYSFDVYSKSIGYFIITKFKLF
ncbi:uncharacterized protein LOC129800610 [Phlebotomus papatasi]|uniref:uncharacterized protein LOC129800610 n=1 Tax=Phlebotomus papatasi TaxID=29031 RepID=UPI002484251E|nr:uncharacterized protein LOC129800610 [Phlebotomus papatasi]